MDKTEVLQAIQELAAKGELLEAEVQVAVEAGKRGGAIRLPVRRFALSEVLYYLGGAIIVLGIVVLLGQNWHAFTKVTRVLVSLGSGLIAYIVGVLTQHRHDMRRLSSAFYLVAAAVLPMGLAITFHESGYDVGNQTILAMISFLLLTMFAVTLFTVRRAVVALAVFVYGSWFFFALTNHLFGQQPDLDLAAFHEYQVLVTGLALVVLSYAMDTRTFVRELTGVLYGVGTAAFLGAALALGGWSPRESVVWEATFPLWAFGAVVLAVYLKSKSMLTFGALFIMAYIMKITAEYFSNSLGWPLALVVAGFGLMATGYVTFYLNREYLSPLRSLEKGYLDDVGVAAASPKSRLTGGR